MKVEILDSVSKLSKFEDAWNELASRCPSLSLYSSYDYNFIAWKHLSSPRDRLFVLALYDGTTIKAIAPFCITRQKIRGISVRSIDFIAAWEGDKPSIIAPSCEDAAWDAIYSFLTKDFHSWDVVNIMEQPQDSNLLSQCAFLHSRKFDCQITHDSTSYHIDITGSWEPYLAAIDAKVKRNWRSRSKKLEELPNGLSVETITHHERTTDALDRFVSLEKMSWKGKDAIGIHRDASSRLFYDEITSFLAEKGQADIFFLTVGGKDIAGAIMYQYRDVVYERHIAYDPEYAKLSPGIYLRTCVLQHYFGKRFREYDMMGMSPKKGVPAAKADWASGIRETRQLLVQKKNLKLMPILLGRKIKAYFKSSMPHKANNTVSIENNN